VSSVTAEEINEVWDNYNESIKQLEDFEFKTEKTKKEIIEKLRDSVAILQENNKITIEPSQISSYCWNVLLDREITYNYSHFISLFEDTQKRNYTKSVLETHSHEWWKEGNIERCKCKVIKFNGVIYDQAKEPKALEKKDLDKDKTPRDFTKQELYLMRCVSNLSGLAKICESLIHKGEDPKVREAIDDTLKDINKLTIEAQGHEAEIIAIGKELDYRQRIGKFEKLKAVLLDKCEYNTAKVAKLLQITPKHMAANIIRKEFPELHENTRNWFKVVEIELEGKKCIIDLGSWFDRQYVRAELGLNIKRPFIISHYAK